MPIERSDIEDIVEQDIRDLVDASRPEGLYIDYKCAPYSKSNPNYKTEILKDVSAFANAEGGHLVIGIHEKGDVPDDIRPISDQDIAGQKKMLESVLSNGMDPTILGIRMHSVSVGMDKSVLVIRIPKSWNAPHRVEAKDQRKFWIRDSQGAHEASVEELRNLFVRSTEVTERVKAFRHERVVEAMQNKGPGPLKAQGRMLLHIIPLAAFGGSQRIDIQRAHALEVLINQTGKFLFAPLAHQRGGGSRPRFNLDGMINLGGSDETGYTQIFRNGILESATSSFVRGNPKGLESTHIPLLIEGIGRFMDGLEALDVQPPFVVMITYQGIANAELSWPGKKYGYYDEEKLQRDNLIFLPDVTIDAYGSHQDYQRQIRPIFDALWNAAGYPKCYLYNDQDEIIGNIA